MRQINKQASGYKHSSQIETNRRLEASLLYNESCAWLKNTKLKFIGVEALIHKLAKVGILQGGSNPFFVI